MPHRERKLYIDTVLFKFHNLFKLRPVEPEECGSGSSVGIATDYGLDGRGSNPGGGEIFRPSRPALWPTQPHVEGYRVFPGGKVRPGRAADHSQLSSAAVMEE